MCIFQSRLKRKITEYKKKIPSVDNNNDECTPCWRLVASFPYPTASRKSCLIKNNHEIYLHLSDFILQQTRIFVGLGIMADISWLQRQSKPAKACLVWLSRTPTGTRYSLLFNIVSNATVFFCSQEPTCYTISIPPL